MNKELKAISLLYPDLIADDQLDLYILLKLDTQIINDLMAIKDFYQLCTQAILAAPAAFNADELKNLPIWSDKDIVMILAAENGYALKNASFELKDDKEVVLVALAEAGLGLDEVSERLRSDKDVVMQAVTTHGAALDDACPDLQLDRDLVIRQMISALEPDNDSHQYFYEWFSVADWDMNLRSDQTLVLQALKIFNEMQIFDDFDEEIESLISNFPSSSQEFIYAIIGINGSWIEYCADEFKADKKIVLAALQNNRRALQFASNELQKDSDVLKAAGK